MNALTSAWLFALVSIWVILNFWLNPNPVLFDVDTPDPNSSVLVIADMAGSTIPAAIGLRTDVTKIAPSGYWLRGGTELLPDWCQDEPCPAWNVCCGWSD
jgi:hypothetical protein